MSGFHYTEFSKTGSILLNAEEKDELFGYIDRLKAENDKLRDATRLMWQRLRWADDVVCCGVIDKRFERRIRELGVEVDA